MKRSMTLTNFYIGLRVIVAIILFLIYGPLFLFTFLGMEFDSTPVNQKFLIYLGLIVVATLFALIIKPRRQLPKIKRKYKLVNKRSIRNFINRDILSDEEKLAVAQKIFDSELLKPEAQFSRLLEKYELRSVESLNDFLRDDSIQKKDKDTVALLTYLINQVNIQH